MDNFSEGAARPTSHDTAHERRAMDDIRDRLARAEQDIKNGKENFQLFKSDDFGSLKKEVHSMRAEFNTKLDAISEKLNTLNVLIAKWVGGIGVLVFLANLLSKHFMG